MMVSECKKLKLIAGKKLYQPFGIGKYHKSP